MPDPAVLARLRASAAALRASAATDDPEANDGAGAPTAQHGAPGGPWPRPPYVDLGEALRQEIDQPGPPKQNGGARRAPADYAH